MDKTREDFETFSFELSRFIERGLIGERAIKDRFLKATRLDPRSPLGPTAWNGLVSVSLKIPPPEMFGWLCCGLCGPNRKPAGGNLKAVAWLNRNCDCEGSKRKFKDGGGRGPRGPRGTGDGWWVGGGEELGDAGDVPPSEMSESSESLAPGPGLRVRRVPPFPVPDCCCILKHNMVETQNVFSRS